MDKHKKTENVWEPLLYTNNFYATFGYMDEHTLPGKMDSHMKTSLLFANSGGLSFTSFTLMSTCTFVS